MMKKIFIIILGAICCANLAFAQIEDKDLGQDKFFLAPKNSNLVDPKKIMVELKPGQTATEEFVLGNASPYQRTFRLYATDFYLNNQGNPDYKNENEERKLSEWIKLDTEEVTLEPKAQKIIKVTFQPPPDLALDNYEGGIAGVYTFPSKSNPNLKIALRYMMGISIKVTDDPQHIPMYGEANIFGVKTYLPLSIAIFIGCMAYFFLEKKKEKARKIAAEADRQNEQNNV